MTTMFKGPGGDCNSSQLGGTNISNAWNGDWQALNNFFEPKKFMFQERFERSMYLQDLGQNGTVDDQIQKLGPNNPRQQFAIAKLPRTQSFRLNSRQEQGSRKLNESPRLEFHTYELGHDLGMLVKFSQDEMYQINQLIGFGNYTDLIDKMFTRAAVNTSTQGILADLIARADTCNIGPKAGRKSHSVNTGTWYKPINLTHNDIPNLYTWAKRIFQEQDVTPQQLKSITGTDRMTCIAPGIFEEYLGDSRFIDRSGLAQCADICEFYMNGVWEYKLRGFETIFDDCLYKFEPDTNGGKRVFPIIFLANGAFAYNAKFEGAELMQGPAPHEHRDFYWEAEMYYGYLLLHPELVTVFWVTLPDQNV